MIEEILQKVKLHQNRAEMALKEIRSWEILDVNIFEDFDKIKSVDTFIYRFIKMQDIIGEKLFRTFLDSIGELKDDMSLLDMVDKLEKFKIIDSADRWIEYRKIRNSLTHEYPNNEDEIVEGIKEAIIAFYEIKIIIENIEKYIYKRGKERF